MYGDLQILATLVAASSCLYLAGMVWNDVFDIEVDRLERPERPLPSGGVSLVAARRLAIALTVGGLVAGGMTGIASLCVAVVLAAMVLGYNAGLKNTLLGPLAMGACRSLNVLLGVSPALVWLLKFKDAELDFGILAVTIALAWWLVPLANGLYITGVTMFSRQEANVSSRLRLLGAIGVMAAGLALHAIVLSKGPDPNSPAWNVGAVFVLLLGFRVFRAVVSPTPRHVQQAVVTAILSLIVIDATLLLVLQTRVHAMWVMLLLPPSLYLGRWLYGT
jgi:4-hydroxybenzoate polyprenyltransferase